MPLHPKQNSDERTREPKEEENETSLRRKGSSMPVIVSVRLRPLNEEEIAEEKAKHGMENPQSQPGDQDDPNDNDNDDDNDKDKDGEKDEKDEEKELEENAKGWFVEKVGNTDIVIEKDIEERVEEKNSFPFDVTFDDNASIDWVYYDLIRPIVQGVFDGKHGTIFTYGQTGSGKTHTMQGDAKLEGGEVGVIQMGVRGLFTHIDNQKENRQYLVRASYYEIYNEQVRDLLGGAASYKGEVTSSHGEDRDVDLPMLKIYEEQKKGDDVSVNSQDWELTCMEDAVRLLQRGNRNRACTSTTINKNSSRSHAIFRIKILSQEKQPDEQKSTSKKSKPIKALKSVLNFVDLVGSDSITACKDQSLVSLSQVISALSIPKNKRPSFINFGDSKLTRIFKSQLSGNSMLAILCCASLSKRHIEETRLTLKFASGAKCMQMKPLVNEILNDKTTISKLEKELEGKRITWKKMQNNQEKSPPKKSAAMVSVQKPTNYVCSDTKSSDVLDLAVDGLGSGLERPEDDKSSTNYHQLTHSTSPDSGMMQIPRMGSMMSIYYDAKEANEDDKVYNVEKLMEVPPFENVDNKISANGVNNGYECISGEDERVEYIEDLSCQSDRKKEDTFQQIVLKPDGTFDAVTVKSVEIDPYRHIFGDDSGRSELLENAPDESYSHIFADEGTFEQEKVVSEKGEEIFTPNQARLPRQTSRIQVEGIFQPSTSQQSLQPYHGKVDDDDDDENEQEESDTDYDKNGKKYQKSKPLQFEGGHVGGSNNNQRFESIDNHREHEDISRFQQDNESDSSYQTNSQDDAHEGFVHGDNSQRSDDYDHQYRNNSRSSEEFDNCNSHQDESEERNHCQNEISLYHQSGGSQEYDESNRNGQCNRDEKEAHNARDVFYENTDSNSYEHNNDRNQWDDQGLTCRKNHHKGDRSQDDHDSYGRSGSDGYQQNERHGHNHGNIYEGSHSQQDKQDVNESGGDEDNYEQLHDLRDRQQHDTFHIQQAEGGKYDENKNVQKGAMRAFGENHDARKQNSLRDNIAHTDTGPFQESSLLVSEKYNSSFLSKGCNSDNNYGKETEQSGIWQDNISDERDQKKWEDSNQNVLDKQIGGRSKNMKSISDDSSEENESASVEKFEDEPIDEKGVINSQLDMVVYSSNRIGGQEVSSEPSDLSAGSPADEGEDRLSFTKIMHTSTCLKNNKTTNSTEEIPPGQVVCMLDRMETMDGKREINMSERLREAEQRAKFLEAKLDETEDLLESLFLELESARKFIRELISRVPGAEKDLEVIEQKNRSKMGNGDLLRQFLLLKYAIYASLVFYLTGHSQLFLATVMFLWLTCEVLTF